MSSYCAVYHNRYNDEPEDIQSGDRFIEGFPASRNRAGSAAIPSNTTLNRRRCGASLPDLESYSIATFTFKYTMIEGSVLETMTARGVDTSDHGEVIDYLAQ